MSFVCNTMNGCFTAQSREAYSACASFVMMILAGIAAAVSVVFYLLAVSVAVRLCLILGIIIILAILAVSSFPIHRKK